MFFLLFLVIFFKRVESFNKIFCLSSDEFIFLNNLTLSFDEAKDFCSNISENVTLASVRDNEEFSFISNFMNENKDNLSFWFGLRRELSSNGTEPESFNFIDKFKNNDFYRIKNVFPWSKEEPNDLTSRQACVLWNRQNNTIGSLQFNRWDDEDCSEIRPFLCRVKDSSNCLLTPTDDEHTDEDENMNVFLLVGLGLVVFCFCVCLLFVFNFREYLNLKRTLNEVKQRLKELTEDSTEALNVTI